MVDNFAAVVLNAVPTLGQFGLLAFLAGLAGVGVYSGRRNKKK